MVNYLKSLFCIFQLLIIISQTSQSQDYLNTKLISHTTFDVNSNDIWGFEKDGIYYAVIGNFDRTSIFSLENPSEPLLVYEAFGANSIWRDIKYYKDHLYVTADSGQDGLLIIDVAKPKEQITHLFYKPVIELNTEKVTLKRSHNLYIDDKGFCYLAGSNVGAGGSLIFDLNTDPKAPSYAGIENFAYSHDAFVTNDTLYTSEIYTGNMGMYDVSDKSNITLLGSHFTPHFFTHNVWGDGKNKLAFTTDERASAYVTAYDVSNPKNIIELDRYYPAISAPEGLIPHNTHYLNGYLVTSWYTDGLRIIDANKPDNLVEVAYYDTWEDQYFCHNSYHGNWGAFPYTNSNLVYASDIENGLFVIEVDYKRAAYFEGTITDESGKQLAGVKIEFEGDGNNINFSNPDGTFKTGTYVDGPVKVRISKNKYETQTITVNLERSEVLEMNLVMKPINESSVTIQLVDSETDAPIQGKLRFWTNDISKFSDINGSQIVSMPAVTGDVVIESWGYLPYTLKDFDFTTQNTHIFALTRGYADVFDASVAWTPLQNISGPWEIAKPRPTTFENVFAAPPHDSDDAGDFALVTVNGIPGADCGDVDSTPAVIESKSMNLSAYNKPKMAFDLWFYSNKEDGNQSFSIEIFNTEQTIQIFRHSSNTDGWVRFEDISIPEDFPLTEDLALRLIAVDNNTYQSVFEVGFDNIEIQSTLVNTNDVIDNALTFYPNPITDMGYLYTFEGRFYTIYDALGRKVLEGNIENNIQEIDVHALEKGVYILQSRGERNGSVKFVKM